VHVLRADLVEVLADHSRSTQGRSGSDLLDSGSKRPGGPGDGVRISPSTRRERSADGGLLGGRLVVVVWLGPGCRPDLVVVGSIRLDGARAKYGFATSEIATPTDRVAPVTNDRGDRVAGCSRCVLRVQDPELVFRGHGARWSFTTCDNLA